MINILPTLVAPSPCIALHAKHEEHDDVHPGYKHQQGNIGIVPDTPDPIEQNGTPAPMIQLFWNNDRFSLAGGVFHRFHSLLRGWTDNHSGERSPEKPSRTGSAKSANADLRAG